MRLGTAGLHVRIQLALEKLPHKNCVARFHAKTDRVANQDLRKTNGQFGREVANLVGVGEQHDGRIRLLDQLLECCRVSVGRIGSQQIVSNGIHLVQFLLCEFAGEGVDTLANYCGGT